MYVCGSLYVATKREWDKFRSRSFHFRRHFFFFFFLSRCRFLRDSDSHSLWTDICEASSLFTTFGRCACFNCMMPFNLKYVGWVCWLSSFALWHGTCFAVLHFSSSFFSPHFFFLASRWIFCLVATRLQQLVGRSVHQQWPACITHEKLNLRPIIFRFYFVILSSTDLRTSTYVCVRVCVCANR